MRIPKELISIISRGIIRELIKRGVISSLNQKETERKVENIIHLDIKKDTELTEKAKEILDKRIKELKSGEEIDYRKVLSKIKRELAEKEKYVLWSSEAKFPEDKIWDLSRKIAEFLKKDEDIEYFVKSENLVKEIVVVFKGEIKKDVIRELEALKKVKAIKRNIVEGTPEFEALKESFYREQLLKEA